MTNSNSLGNIRQLYNQITQKYVKRYCVHLSQKGGKTKKMKALKNCFVKHNLEEVDHNVHKNKIPQKNMIKRKFGIHR